MPLLLIAACAVGSGCESLPNLHPLEKALAPAPSQKVTGAIAPSAPGDQQPKVVAPAAGSSGLLPGSPGVAPNPPEPPKGDDFPPPVPSDPTLPSQPLTSKTDADQTAQPTQGGPMVELTEVTPVPIADPNEKPVDLPPAIEPTDAVRLAASSPIPEPKPIAAETRSTLPAPELAAIPDPKPAQAPTPEVPTKAMPVVEAKTETPVVPEPRPAAVSPPDPVPLADARPAGPITLNPKPEEPKPVLVAPPEPLPTEKPTDEALPQPDSKVEASSGAAPEPKPLIPDIAIPVEAAPKPAPMPEPQPAPAIATPEAVDPTPATISPLSEDWGSSLSRLREFATLKSEEPGAATDLWKGRLRLINGMAEISQAPKVWSRVLPALSVASSPEPADPSVLGARLREATDAIEALAPLEIADLRLCRKVQAFGVFDAIDPHALRRGQAVILYCEMVGLQSAPTADKAGFESKLTSRIELTAAGSSQPVWSDTLHKDDICPKRRRDVFVNYRITIPANVAPGPYALKLTQTDETTGKTATRSIELQVQP